jgi:hypothetical protein
LRIPFAKEFTRNGSKNELPQTTTNGLKMFLLMLMSFALLGGLGFLIITPLKKLTLNRQKKTPQVTLARTSFQEATNFFMPPVVPNFDFGCEAGKLVKLLDTLSNSNLNEATVHLEIAEIDFQSLEREISQKKTFELECLHCVLGLLLHIIYFNYKVYIPQLVEISNQVAKILNASVGGSCNVTFLYNWQHVSIKPGETYNSRDLNSTNIVPRFQIFSNQKESLWTFLKAHILMESKACLIFDNIIDLYTLKEKFEHNLINRQQLVAEIYSNLNSINLHMINILSLMKENIHSNKVFLQDWKTIQNFLKFPNYDGIVGLQNCWLLALNYIVNVTQPENVHNKHLEIIAWKHLLPNQRFIMEHFKTNSQFLFSFVLEINHPPSSLLLQEFVRNIILWRSVHRSRALQYISYKNNSDLDNYETSVGIEKNVNQVKHQLDSRLKEFSLLKTRILS